MKPLEYHILIVDSFKENLENPRSDEDEREAS